MDEHSVNTEIIRRYDEVISGKASKLELDKILLDLRKVPSFDQFK